MTARERVLTLWLPDWPVTAYLRTVARDLDRAEPVDESLPLAILHANRVVACSESARAAGVRRGQRRRDAQGACPSLRIVSADPDRDARAFDEVLRLIETLSPGAQTLQPGLAVLRARGPARFYGGEREASVALADALAEAGLDARAGVADGIFTAEQAVRALARDQRVAIVPAGAAAEFLASLPVAVLGDVEIAQLLIRLGVKTLGDFAALEQRLVHERLGEHGLRLQRLAGGSDSRQVGSRTPPPDFAQELDLEPPLELAEQVAFATRQAAERFCDRLGASGLVCTALRVTLEDDRGGRSERVWQHPVSFDAASTVDRVRWQLQPAQGHRRHPAHEPLRGAILRVRIEPEAVDDGAAHQPALIGQGSDERAHHAMTRVQAMLGHLGVVTPAVGGGRWAAERELLVPWGEAVSDTAQDRSTRDAPWPGSLPAPVPSELFRDRRPARVRGAAASEVGVDDRGLLTEEPRELDGRRVVSWAGPWPVVERLWDSERTRVAHRFQLVDETGSAWLAVRENGDWWLEGRYA